MSRFFAKDYLPVNQRESAEGLGDVEKVDAILPRSNLKKPLWKVASSYLCWILVLALVVSNWYTWAKLRTSTPRNAVFSPAQTAIKYKNVVFNAGIDGDVSPYSGWPTPENDRLWEDLFQFGVSRIPMSDAAKLTNRTSPIPNEPGQYIVILSVFHQLHCLAHIRKRIFWNEAGSPDDNKDLTMKHMDHCIDLLRQSLMCSSDITPLPFGWFPDIQQVLPTTAAQHTCRDFDAIRDWAEKRRAPKMDMSIQVEDPLGNVVFGQ